MPDNLEVISAIIPSRPPPEVEKLGLCVRGEYIHIAGLTGEVMQEILGTRKVRRDERDVVVSSLRPSLRPFLLLVELLVPRGRRTGTGMRGRKGKRRRRSNTEPDRGRGRGRGGTTFGVGGFEARRRRRRQAPRLTSEEVILYFLLPFLLAFLDPVLLPLTPKGLLLLLAGVDDARR